MNFGSVPRAMRLPAQQLTRLPQLSVWALLVAAFALVSPLFVLCALPILGLVALLTLGRFPGEELIERIRERHAPQPRRRRRVLATRRWISTFVRPVGLAATFALAMRPPPAAGVCG